MAVAGSCAVPQALPREGAVPAEAREEAAESAALAFILALLRERTGTDFACYRRATVLRRIRNRMISVGTASMDAYAGLLAERPDEAQQLLQRITIKVSRFYRNGPAFDHLREHVLPVLARRAAGRPLRLWSAGCGCGEEPYTLAMLLEAMALPGSVVATDLDPGALALAGAAGYPAEAVRELPPTLHGYLEQDGPQLRVAAPVRARVRFLRHDLSRGAPPVDGGFDLVACRNVLIYFDRALQQRVFALLQRALLPGGVLFLGEAEWPPLSAEAPLQSLCRGSRLFQLPEIAA